MGYTTAFDGYVRVEPPLNEVEIRYLRRFTGTRRMHRKNGPYYVDGTGLAGQARESDILDYNGPDPSQPGLWCNWIPTDDGKHIEWDGGEKFYDSEEWMRYLIDHFLKPDAEAKKELDDLCSHCGRGGGQFSGFSFDHVVNGQIFAQGEDPDDKWMLNVENNVVTTKRAKIVWE